MREDPISRRSILAISSSLAIAGIGVVSTGAQEADSRESFTLLEGTDRETTVHVARGAADGPTVVVVGGMHGNEVAGYEAAAAIADWQIEAGILVTIPEANALAVERGTRNAGDGADLNRQFPEAREPTSELAQAIWGTVAEFDPDVLIDLHESTRLYDGNAVDGVGQAVFYSAGNSSVAEDAANYVTRNYVDDPDLAFRPGSFTATNVEPRGLLAHKAARDLGTDAFLAETLSTDIALDTRVRWHTAIVERLAGDGLFPEGSPTTGGDSETPDDRSTEDGDEAGSEDGDEAGSEDGDEAGSEDGDEEEAPNEVDEEELDEADEGGEEAEQEPDEDGHGEDEASADGGADDADEGDGGTEAEAGGPIARIQVAPESSNRSIEPGDTVSLDASESCSSAGEIVSYEWTVHGAGSVDGTGESITMTVASEGDHRIVLCVTDDAGHTDTAELTLSTA